MLFSFWFVQFCCCFSVRVSIEYTWLCGGKFHEMGEVLVSTTKSCCNDHSSHTKWQSLQQTQQFINKINTSPCENLCVTDRFYARAQSIQMKSFNLSFWMYIYVWLLLHCLLFHFELWELNILQCRHKIQCKQVFRCPQFHK